MNPTDNQGLISGNVGYGAANLGFSDINPPTYGDTEKSKTCQVPIASQIPAHSAGLGDTGYQQPPAGYQQPPAGYQQPPAGYQQQSAGYQQPPAGYQLQAPAGGHAWPWNWCLIVTAAFACFLCPMFGYIATVMGLLSYTDYKAQHYDKAKSKRNVSLGFGIAGIIIGLLLIIFYIVIIVMVIKNAVNSYNDTYYEYYDWQLP